MYIYTYTYMYTYVYLVLYIARNNWLFKSPVTSEKLRQTNGKIFEFIL
jgi:hypothetical protein